MSWTYNLFIVSPTSYYYTPKPKSQALNIAVCLESSLQEYKSPHESQASRKIDKKVGLIDEEKLYRITKVNNFKSSLFAVMKQMDT